MLRNTQTTSSIKTWVFLLCACLVVFWLLSSPVELEQGSQETPCFEDREWMNNLGSACYQDICAPVIDIVYTWVNGSDPKQIEELRKVKDRLLQESNLTALPKCNSTQNPETDGCWKDDATSNRYIDNEELRYSLRSVEKFAPWVRHIYLVTNGQIPYWLNVDHPKLTVVTHEQIFRNKSHLPTFSSPAIEANLHNIPGLARHWIYLNDDVMFGEEVWPDDFVTTGKGQKVFLAWPVPDCAEGCPSSWCGDGFCDLVCNTTACDFDGGDCIGSNVTFGGGWQGSGLFNSLQSDRGASASYCTQGCPDPWIGDKYCDKGCMYEDCGMDGGDCGLSDVFNTMVGTSLADVNRTGLIEVDIEFGLYAFYFNLSGVVGDDQVIVDAYHDNNVLVRTSVLRKTSKILIVLLKPVIQRANIQVIWAKANDLNDKENITMLVNVVDPDTSTNDVPAPQPMTTETIPTTKDDDEKDLPGEITIESVVNDWSSRERRVEISEKVRVRYSEMEEGYKMEPSFKIAIEDETEADVVDTPKRADEGRLNLISANEDWKKIDSIIESSPKAAERRIEGYKSLLEKKLFYNFLSQTKKGEYWEDDSSETVLQPLTDLTDEEYHDFLRDIGTRREFQELARAILEDPFFASLMPRENKKRDNYGDSLKHVNKLLNKEFGASARRVPAHMPHFLDSDIIKKVHALWPAQFDVTSSNQLRSGTDMQFAFSYFYYLMHERIAFDWDIIWDKYFDKDGDGEIELRAQIVRLYKISEQAEAYKTWYNCTTIPLPEPQQGEEEAEDDAKDEEEGAGGDSKEGNEMDEVLDDNAFVKRSDIGETHRKRGEEAKQSEPKAEEQKEKAEEVKEDKTETKDETEKEDGNKDQKEEEGGKNVKKEEALPKGDLTKAVVKNCPKVFDHIEEKYRKILKNKFEVLDTDDVAFRMLPTNASRVTKMLDEILAASFKFICLNDNMDHASNESVAVVKEIEKFYLTLFPLPSSFELPPGKKNKELYIRDYVARKLHAKIRAETENHKAYKEQRQNFAFYTILFLLFCCGWFCLISLRKRAKGHSRFGGMDRMERGIKQL